MSTEPPATDRSARETAHAMDMARAPDWIHFSSDPLPWSEAEAARWLGGKGSSLCLLNRAGYRVPASFTITTHACQYFHAHERDWPDGLWTAVRAAVARLETQAGRSFGHGPNSLTLAVRSGAAESMPGLMSTVLHCGLSESLVLELDNDLSWEAFAEFLDNECLLRAAGVDLATCETRCEAEQPRSFCERVLAATRAAATGRMPDDPEALLRLAISAVWDSWNMPAARRFRELRGGDHAAGTAVTIQVMFETQVAGVAFSKNPERPLSDELVIEAALGLGRALVGGQTTPARWLIDRKTQTVRDIAIPAALAGNPSLQDFEQHLTSLCQAVLQIESLYQTPVDVEFGCAKQELVFFQARPMCRARTSRDTEHARISERSRVLELGQRGPRLWVRHNLAESLPAPTPLTWDLWREFMSGRGGYGKLYRQLGYRPSRVANQEGFLELIAGRIYVAPERLTEMICRGYPFTFDLDALRADPNAINRTPTRVDLNQLDSWFLLRWPFIVWLLARSARIRHRLANQAATDFETLLVPSLHAFVDAERQVNLSSMSVKELLKAFERRRQRVFEDFAPQTLLPGTLGVGAWSALEQRLLPILGAAACQSLLHEWLIGIENPVAAREQALLVKLARNETTVDVFLREFGHRGPNEMDLSAPRWREIPETVAAVAERVAATQQVAADKQPKQSPEHLLRVALERNGAGCLYRELAPLLTQAVHLLPFREIGKQEFLKAYELLRDVVLELSRRLGLGEGIHFLSLAELNADSMPREIEAMITSRRDHHRACQQLHVSPVLEIDGELEDFGLPPMTRGGGRSLSGTSLSFGQASGRVFLFEPGMNLTELAADSIVVAATIEPGMIPFLTHVAALVVEQGGVLSHVALLARQFSIPVVVVAQITIQARRGETIRVDADRGFVELPERLP